jgi:hypothetical protein
MFEQSNVVRAHGMNVHNEQTGITPRQAAASVERCARQRLAEIQVEERRQLEEAFAAAKAETATWRRDLEDELMATVAAAKRNVNAGGAMIVKPGQTDRLATKETLQQMRASAKPGQLTMVAYAQAPKLGERGIPGPAFVVVDVTGALGLRED